MKYYNSSIMRSNLLDKDFELLCKASTLKEVVDDGFAIDLDFEDGLFVQKKQKLTTRLQDFLDCTKALDNSDLQFRWKGINRRWGTSHKLHETMEKKIGRKISHGALLLALDLRGMKLERIQGRKDVYMNISGRSRWI